ncbi:MAG TPA: hypothetical protein PLZ21_06815 [Armatimonadota bacterium]|nr:hypothetical protein [Armatimonadota bacterium]
MAPVRVKKRSAANEFVIIVADLGLKVGAVLFGLVLVWLFYNLSAKNGVASLIDRPQVDRDLVMGRVGTACVLLGVFSGLTALCAAIRYYAEEILGYLMSLLGVLLYFGMPWLLTSSYSGSNQFVVQTAGSMAYHFRIVGMLFFVPGVLLILKDIYLRITLAGVRHAKEDNSFGEDEDEESKRHKIYARCWEMPYCRSFLRATCPAYQAHKSCWRIKVGCLCDPEVAAKALRTKGGSTALREDIQNRMQTMQQKKTTLTNAQKRERCRMCIVYDYHQQQKYKLISPIVLPFVIALIWTFYPKLATLITAAIQYTDQIMRHASFLPDAAQKLAPVEAVPPSVVAIFIVWVGIVGFSYALRLLEYCIFKAQI